MKSIKPVKIGSTVLEKPVMLAPMAGVTDLPFRLLCRERGCGLVVTEMVSAKAIHFNNKNTRQLLVTEPEETPVSVQLFGSEPAVMAQTAAALEELPFSFIDVNMGCPVPKIVNNGEGSALMKNPALAFEILSAMVRSVKKPVTVKFRKGFDETCVNAVEFAKMAEAAGVASLTVHGRTRSQFYSGKADWDIIRQVKEAVKIPVFGNGDIFKAQDALDMMEETGCDGVAVARGAKGNPWIFEQIVSLMEGREAAPPSVGEIKAMIDRHTDMMIHYKGEYVAMREMRKHVAWYTAGLPHSSRLRGLVNEVETRQELTQLLDELLQE